MTRPEKPGGTIVLDGGLVRCYDGLASVIICLQNKEYNMADMDTANPVTGGVVALELEVSLRIKCR